MSFELNLPLQALRESFARAIALRRRARSNIREACRVSAKTRHSCALVS